MNIPIVNERPVKLDAAALTWFNNLKNQYLALPLAQMTSDVQRKIIAAIDDLSGKDANTLVIQNLFDLEDWVLTLLPGQTLASRLKSLRDEYQEVLGKEAWDRIQPTLLPQIDPAKEDENRAEAQRLQEELHWQASIRPWASRMRKWMMLSVLTLMGLAMLILWLNVNRHGTEMAGTLMLIGIVGGAVSTIQRIQSANLASSRALMLARYSLLKLGVIISPVLGGIFALVMALFLMSKTVTPGLVVPDMTVGYPTNCASVKDTHANTNQTNLRDGTNAAGKLATAQITAPNDVTAKTTPSTGKPNEPAATSPKAVGPDGQKDKGEVTKTGQTGPGQYTFFSLPVFFTAGKDLALFLLWAFTAGFSERLVPDLLTKLAEPKKP